MTERQRNRKYIARKLNKAGIGYTLEQMEIILDICDEVYLSGLKQGHTDREMDSLIIIEDLQNRIIELEDKLNLESKGE